MVEKSPAGGRILWEARVPVRIDAIASEILFATRLDLGEGTFIAPQ
jgi:hypothetical protein